MHQTVRSTVLGAVAASVVVLAACAVGSSDGTLVAADLPEDPESSESVETVSPLMRGCSLSAESGMVSGPNDVWATTFVGVDGDDGDDVTSAVFSLAYWGERGDHPAGWLEWLDEGVSECVAAGSAGGDGWAETVAITDGLPADAYGYSVVRTGSDAFSGSRAYAAAGEVLVQVSVYHQGSGEPSLAAADLLKTAIERAEAEFGTGR